jgi:hypothetical protein
LELRPNKITKLSSIQAPTAIILQNRYSRQTIILKSVLTDDMAHSVVFYSSILKAKIYKAEAIKILQ